MNIERLRRIQPMHVPKPSGKRDPEFIFFYCSLLQNPSIVLGVVWAGKVNERHAEPLCPLSHAAMLVIRDNSNDIGIQHSGLCRRDKVLKPRSAPAETFLTVLRLRKSKWSRTRAPVFRAGRENNETR